ncbi:MAG: methylated-DNA--[protein]-cysteine S-methyltransferase [Candidatus Obscuribacterales bacterium]|nr:methylated-DNA--[protein]-cysteine S-methyltransferase [Candidatus Obscuribacterales bacterium]
MNPKLYFSLYESPLAQLLLTSDGVQLTGIYFPEHKNGPTIETTWLENNEKLNPARLALNEYFAYGGLRELPSLKAKGTEFQESVWQELLKIPSGTTSTYGAIARKIGRKNAVRAVGAAVGRNPISILIPCHRVTGSKGLTGFAGGLDRKAWLLLHEKTSVP